MNRSYALLQQAEARRDRAGALRYETINADLAPARAHPGCAAPTAAAKLAVEKVLIGVGNRGCANMQLPEINEP
jgi:hypothetical protein